METQKTLKVILAFKKGNGFFSKLIKWWTKSKYSHVEILLPNKDGEFNPGVWVSANHKKGVRIKPIIYPLDDVNWDYVDVEVPAENYDNAMKKIDEIVKYKYATLDLFLVQVFKLDKMENRKKMFCSESVCEILKAFKEPKIIHLDKKCVNYSPGDLYEIYVNPNN
jgi:hypothetical protein